MQCLSQRVSRKDMDQLDLSEASCSRRTADSRHPAKQLTRSWEANSSKSKVKLDVVTLKPNACCLDYDLDGAVYNALNTDNTVAPMWRVYLGCKSHQCANLWHLWPHYQCNLPRPFPGTFLHPKGGLNSCWTPFHSFALFIPKCSTCKHGWQEHRNTALLSPATVSPFLLNSASRHNCGGCLSWSVPQIPP